MRDAHAEAACTKDGAAIFSNRELEMFKFWGYEKPVAPGEVSARISTTPEWPAKRISMHRPAATLLFLLSLLPFAAQAAAPLPMLAVALEKKPAGTFYVDGAIEGYGALELLVDTGSSLVVINEDILARLKAAGAIDYSHDLDGNMADGSKRNVQVYRISALRIGKDCWIRDVEAAVIQNNVRPILGMNVLSRLSPFTFSAEPPQLMLNQCSGLPVQASVTSPASLSAAEVSRKAARGKTLRRD